MNALSFSGSDFKLNVSRPTGDDDEEKPSKSGHSLSPSSQLAIPGGGKSQKLSLRIRPAATEDAFEKSEQSSLSAKSEDLSSPRTPTIMLTPDDDADTPSIFIPSSEDNEQVERLNKGRKWNDIEAEAVGKEKFRQVLNELLSKRGNQLPVGKQDKDDEENYKVMTRELDKRKAQNETLQKETEVTGIKSRKSGSLSLDA